MLDSSTSELLMYHSKIDLIASRRFTVCFLEGDFANNSLTIDGDKTKFTKSTTFIIDCFAALLKLEFVVTARARCADNMPEI